MSLWDRLSDRRAAEVPWIWQARHDVVARPPSERDDWNDLLSLASGATSAKPTKRWTREATALLARIGIDSFVPRLERWLALAPQPSRRNGDEATAPLLRGVAWIAGLTDDARAARGLGALAIASFKRRPGVGPRSLVVGNACIHALGQMTVAAALGQLAILRARIRGRAAQNAIEKALVAAAERTGIAPDELEELGVPDYDLDRVGEAAIDVGGATATLAVDENLRVHLAWTGADGKPRKSVPATVRNEHAAALAELRARVKDVQAIVNAQRDRLDHLALSQRTWAYPVWRARYLDHPIVGVIARRLIWRFESGDMTWDGIHHPERGLVDRDGIPLDRLDDETRVRPWHPIASDPDDVVQWRHALEAAERRQPFKQAHREVYLLTAAERETNVYSNRFAGHVLKQHQFQALATARGWTTRLRLMVDDVLPPPSKSLPSHDLRAEFWVEGIHGDWGVATNDRGVYHYLATDQVRFYRIDATQRLAHAVGGGYQPDPNAPADEPIPLADVPALAFSEVMRDVDLFVGVATIGNDPEWADGGPDGRYRDYWQQYAFGELGASAATRRDVLSRLIPRLAIADRCTLEDRFLTVRGDLRGYKIHLGSGNILMTPNDQYLCIVAEPPRERTRAGRVFLPFEGDAMLSMILSKALMLANDTAIDDPSIVEQIRR